MTEEENVAPVINYEGIDSFRRLLILIVLFSVTLSCGCSRSKDFGGEVQVKRLIVIATLFPLYDFAKNIVGGSADVRLLLPPGTEPHSFEPKASDMVMLNRADIFIYTNKFMEPWAEHLLKGRGDTSLSVIDASQGVRFIDGSGDSNASRKKDFLSKSRRKQEQNAHDGQGADPHIWLDFTNAQKMVDTIAMAVIVKDPENRDFYTRNAEAYKSRLRDLDIAYQEGLSNCQKGIIVNGGHYVFGYLANRYGLRYRAAYGFSPDAEPTARNLADISKTLRKEGLHHLFYEELLSPRIAETIARETGATLLKLHGAHNISKDELSANRSFIGLMENNLDNLMTGLQCRN